MYGEANWLKEATGGSSLQFDLQPRRQRTAALKNDFVVAKRRTWYRRMLDLPPATRLVRGSADGLDQPGEQQPIYCICSPSNEETQHCKVNLNIGGAGFRREKRQQIREKQTQLLCMDQHG
jgi:hypothetical protein